MKVLITAPLRQEVKIFQEYQKSLDAFDADRFFVVNDCDEVIPYIKGEYIVCNTGDTYVKGDTHIWTQQNLGKMPFLRNLTIQYALEHGYDYWFSVDTDLVLHPKTLETLLEADKDIVSEIFYTDNWCNAWMYGQYTPPLEEWKKAGLYRVGMTGACTLVKRKVLEKCDYSFIPNVDYWGEDRHFCIRAAVHGFEMWLDTHYPATHLYTEEMYQKYMEVFGR